MLIFSLRYRHESASGYYRVSVYFLALVFADLIPNRLIPNILFSTIIYFMTGAPNLAVYSSEVFGDNYTSDIFCFGLHDRFYLLLTLKLL